ncbi:MAG: arginine--tRNA ligase [Sutterella parvirubra]|nr:arginine--tRNA ligase [Sutterella parvirubra]
MLAQQKEAVSALIQKALAELGQPDAPVVLERPKSPEHGDVACTSALQLARAMKKAPRQIAEDIVAALRRYPETDALVSSIEIAGPGFINMRVADGARQDIVRQVLREGEAFGRNDAHKGESVLLEFVSANPTGPLHLGHARQGALGDVLANILATQGWAVTREFYYNDAGVQIGNLAESVKIRCRQLQGEAVDLPESAYHGEYIISIARDFLDKKPVHAHSGEVIESTGDFNDTDLVRRYSVAYLRNEQDDDLAALGVRFDNFYLESSLYTSGRVEAAVKAMIDSGRTYEAENALWLKTTSFEDLGHGIKDDKDRVMRKADGTYTYFVPDVAYHLAKFERGFTKAVNIQGTDHHGTIARVRAGLQAAGSVMGLAISKEFPEYILHKMLSVIKDGEPVKMSKRSGNYVTLHDLVEWAGRDAARFFLVSRKSDAEFVFDVTLAQQKSDENPVYYLQYAHARICSVFAKALEQGYAVPSDAELAGADLSALTGEAAGQLLAAIAEYPQMLTQAARDHAPHVLCYYLKDLAAAFHAFYNAERVVVEDETERNARLALLAAARRVLANGFALLGISAPESMRREDEA